MGSSLTVPIADGRLALGTWQVSAVRMGGSPWAPGR